MALRHNVPPFQPPGGKQRQGPRWAPLALTAALAPTSIPLMVGPTSLDTCASTTELDFGMPTCSTGVIERQQSALMTRAASEAALAALAAAAARSASGVGGAAGGSSGVEMLQQREDVEAQRARDNGGGDEHQKLGSELLASFQHWMPNQPQQGAVHYRHQQQGGQFVGHMQQGAHAAGAGAEVGPMYHRPSNDAEAEADARSYGDHGHAGMGEQVSSWACGLCVRHAWARGSVVLLCVRAYVCACVMAHVWWVCGYCWRSIGPVRFGWWMVMQLLAISLLVAFHHPL